ncbi:DUF3895 domain-containing protein [Bacillus inaquosorum]|uniref:DUF3895 domain-containing protein n=1 Tax=Bacillus inaquosorum TaxID=483913 RepID=UPI002281115C|nr:DUF3895 domain-containing protein [Bacillus inaquosorum]MCY9397649.1 DUF3895 domain-containing protein [Bacillus inaquosorum]
MDKDFSFLNEEQKQFLTNYVKVKKLEAFNKIQTEASTGYAGFEGASGEDLQLLIDEWVLIDYIDNGFVDKNTPCECGRPLRYQYIVRNNKSGEVKRLGINHFEEHISLKKHVVKKIKKEFDLIEKEVSEISERTRVKWSIENVIHYIPNDYKFCTNNLKQQLDMGLALSAKQVNSLMKEVNQKVHSDNKAAKTVTLENIDLFNYDEPKKISTVFSLNDTQKETIRDLYYRGVKSPRVICEMLIEDQIAPSNRYSTGKPKIFPNVCVFLEEIKGN